MDALTPAERRGALVVVLLLALGAGRDLWRATRPLPDTRSAPAPAAPALVPGARGTLGDATAPTGAGSAGGDGGERAAASQLVDLNRATAGELDALPGIGPVLAARIVAHRQRHGPFRTREELLAVRGIGPRLLARLGTRVRVVGNEVPGRPDTLAQR